ncbi:MAG: UDP-N-acetylglucosamine--N-acetylmuramyl-(pentapeptide) pyrophosphoryl-undecaprenol N-acetylglucosamine transferase [Leptolyngbya sp. SIO4C1]|nr:UDP-N-acetylglucosamine--N-acetylmuramyl-(pentapeptide) pyrophosphoryl-undecaprenol N-acetylglucosamine transferase [Leptolyngbya sp. SIO4C1]
MPAKWLIYALGSGWGHLNRAVALARRAAQPVEILTNSAYAEPVQTGLDTPLVQLNRLPVGISVEAAKRYVHQWLKTPHAGLIVDTFPRGLVGELAEHCESEGERRPWLWVHRDLKPDYIAAKQVAGFVERHYRLVLVPGEVDAPLRQLPQARMTAPWLIRDAAELQPVRAAVRSRLRLSADRPLVVLCATGRPEQCDRFGRLAVRLAQAFPQLTIRCLAYQRPRCCPPALWMTHWPGLEVLQLASVAIGGAGYNTVYECAALGIPLISMPLAQIYDRQYHRAAQLSLVARCPAEVLKLLPAALELSQSDSCPRRYPNGVHAAVRHISQALESARPPTSKPLPRSRPTRPPLLGE